MILSLPNLTTVEIIGEYSPNNEGPSGAARLREPNARKVRDVRLRGYVPAKFVSEMCKASTSNIVYLDSGALEPLKQYHGDAEEMEWQEELGYLIYVAPRGLLWLKQFSAPSFSSLTHILLCKRGSFDGPPEMSEKEDAEVFEDTDHEVEQLKEWASLLFSIRSTVVEIVLEQRPVYLEYLVHHGLEISKR
jgi:hypothetical protein